MYSRDFENMKIRFFLTMLLTCSVVFVPLHAQVVNPNAAVGARQDQLPSWNETESKQAVLDFVAKVTAKGTKDFVPSAERVAVFDNDGTLWPEAPIPFQVAFAFDELKRRVPTDSELAADPMVQAALAGDIGKLLEGKHHDGLLHVLGLTHAGMTTDDFDSRVRNWLASAKHPRFNKPYTDLTYQPMQELLKYLRDNGFKTFIVSGGGADFMRVWSEQVYNIPPEYVVGSTGQVKFEMRNGVPVLIKTIDHLFVDDKEGKPVGIHHFIGRRPIACFGNSDGDQAMLEYTTIGNPHPSFGLIVHHTDADREYAYDANPKGSGKLTTALEVAPQRGWTVVDMKQDWKQIWNNSNSMEAPDMENSIVGKWLAKEIDGSGVLDNAQSTLEVRDDGSVAGDSAVNRYNGKATINGQKIKFDPLAMTRRAGPPALMDQETRFMKALGRIDSFHVNDTTLNMLDSDGNVVVRFTKDK
jgi:heat shock protein HslJ/phosphoglycolate phosphatase-like HAD superfamily hydrolase